MSKIKKTLLILSFLIIATVLFSVVIANQYAVALPVRLIPMHKYPFVGPLISNYLFWVSVILLAVLLILLLVVIFYPNKKTEMVLKEGQGKLVVEKGAIENFVKSILESEEFVKDPKVKVKMTKHKIKIYVKGTLMRTSDVFGKSEILAKRIENEVKAFIGVKENVTIKVEFDHYQKEKKYNTSRVV